MTTIIPLVVALLMVCGATAQNTDTSGIDTNARHQASDTTVYEQNAVDSPAHFKGGKEAWTLFLIHNLQGDIATRNGAPKGEYGASVKFVVNKKGNIKKIMPLTKTGYGTEEELMRLLKSSPRWVPATINGQPVDSYLTQQLTFKVFQ